MSLQFNSIRNSMEEIQKITIQSIRLSENNLKSTHQETEHSGLENPLKAYSVMLNTNAFATLQMENAILFFENAIENIRNMSLNGRLFEVQLAQIVQRDNIVMITELMEHSKNHLAFLKEHHKEIQKNFEAQKPRWIFAYLQVLKSSENLSINL